MKIIHIITSISRGGRERQLATLVANMDYEKYNQKIIYFNDHEYDYILEYGLEKHIRKVESKNIIARLVEIHKLLKQYKPDIVHTWGNMESVIAMILKPFHSYKLLNGSVRHGIRLNKINHYLRSIILHLSRNILSNSYAGLRANNLKRGYVLYNGLDSRLIGRLSVISKYEHRKRIFKEINKTILIISVANMVPYKDYNSILLALKIIKERGYSFFYIILGDGYLRNNIECAIAEYNLIDSVTILGNVTNVNEYLKISDIFIHSSMGEGCSNAILEAMAAGLPIVATDTGGTCEIVNEEYGRLFEYKNSKQLSDILIELLLNKNKIKQMGELSYNAALNKYTIDKMVKKYSQIVHEIYS